MILKKRHCISFLYLIMLSMASQSTLAEPKIYRWTDENGNVHLSDQIPPEHIKLKRESLNKNARTIKVIEKAKTKHQQETEKRFALLRKRQQVIIDKQMESDQVLLNTYQTLESMETALNRKLSSLDGQKRVIQGNLKRLESQLKQQQQKAAQFERDGIKVPVVILKKIAATKDQIDLTSNGVLNHIEKKKRIKKELENDIARFVFLKSKTKKGMKRKQTRRQESELGIYFCQTKQLCNRAWEHARQFVNTYSTTEHDVETPTLIMSLKPEKDTDLSLSVSKFNFDNDTQQLFLDIRCHTSILGKKLCQRPEIQKIRLLFSDYIKSALEFKQG